MLRMKGWVWGSCFAFRSQLFGAAWLWGTSHSDVGCLGGRWTRTAAGHLGWKDLVATGMRDGVCLSCIISLAVQEP